MSRFQKINDAYDARRRAIEELRALDTAIGDADATVEQRTELDTINADIDAKDKVITRLLREGELEERSAFLDGLVGQQSDAGQRDTETGLTPIEKEARALFIRPGEEGSKQSLTFTASPSEVGRLMRRDARRMERRDLLAGTATDGAELVPTTLFGQLYVSLREGADSMFSLGRSIVTMSGETLNFPRVTTFSTAAIVAEAAAASESDPQFATVSLGAFKYGLLIQVSYELGADNAVPGALPWVVDQAIDGIRRGAGAHLITGTGSGQPNGVVNGSNTFTVTGVTYPTADVLINATHDIASPYRRDAVWLFNDDTVAGIRRIKDSTNQYIWQPGLQAGAPDRLLGAPVYTDSSLATVGANAKIGIYGDVKRGYLVRTVAEFRAEMSRDYAWANDLLTWRFYARIDGDIIDNTAFTVLTNQAS